MSGCCGDDGVIHRVNDDGVWETSVDGGVTWYPDPDSDPRNNVNYFPPLPGTDGDDKRCIAATSGMEYVRWNLIDDLNAGSGYADIYAAAIAIIAALGVTGIGLLIAAAAAAIFVAGISAVQAAFTSDVWDKYQCILFCHTQADGTITEDGWNGVKFDINDQFTGIVNVILYNWVNAVGYIGLSNANRSNFATEGDCDDCACTECVDASKIIIGTFIDQGENWIEIESAFDAGYGQKMVVYGSYVVGEFCCYLASSTDISGASPTGTSYVDCDGNPHFASAVGNVFNNVQIGFGSGTGVIRLTFS